MGDTGRIPSGIIESRPLGVTYQRTKLEKYMMMFTNNNLTFTQLQHNSDISNLVVKKQLTFIFSFETSIVDLCQIQRHPIALLWWLIADMSYFRASVSS